MGSEDDRQRQRFDPLYRPDQLVPELSRPLWRDAVELLDVDAAGDGAALGAEEKCPRGICLSRGDGGPQVIDQLAVEEVERWAVERRDRQAAVVALETDERHASAVAGLFQLPCPCALPVATPRPDAAGNSTLQGNSPLPPASGGARATPPR